MLSLNKLEKAVLEKIRQDASIHVIPLLREQIDRALVIGRKNTGVGFYTELKVENAAGRISERVIGDVWADIEGFNEPMNFLVFLRDGTIHELEGVAIADNTVAVDFSNVGFVIRR